MGHVTMTGILYMNDAPLSWPVSLVSAQPEAHSEMMFLFCFGVTQDFLLAVFSGTIPGLGDSGVPGIEPK